MKRRLLIIGIVGAISIISIIVFRPILEEVAQIPPDMPKMTELPATNFPRVASSTPEPIIATPEPIIAKIDPIITQLPSKKEEAMPSIIINIEQPIMPKPQPDPQPQPIPVSTLTIEITALFGGKLKQQYIAYDWDTYNNNNVSDSERPVGFVFPNENNYADIAVIVRDEKGNAMGEEVVKMESSDPSQNKTTKATGTIPIYVGGNKQIVPVYAFHYEFKTAGKHMITFTVGNISEIVEIDVTEK